MVQLVGFRTRGPALAFSKGIDRDRAVDESGNQLTVFGRRGARPLNRAEARALYLRNGQLYIVTDEPVEQPRVGQLVSPPGSWLERLRLWFLPSGPLPAADPSEALLSSFLRPPYVFMLMELAEFCVVPVHASPFFLTCYRHLASKPRYNESFTFLSIAPIKIIRGAFWRERS